MSYRKSCPVRARPIATRPLVGSLCATAVFAALAVSTQAAAQQPTAVSGAAAYTDRIIVRYRDDHQAWIGSRSDVAWQYADHLSRESGRRLHHHRQMGDGAHVLRLDSNEHLGTVAALARKIAQDPTVLYAEPDTRMFTQLAPNDVRFKEQWHYSEPVGGINLLKAWDITTGSPNVVVGVIDTGVRPHADLVAKLLPGFDFIADVTTGNDGNGRDADAFDPGDACPPSSPTSSWHGTHVAGTIGAVTDNGFGVAGINWAAKILPVRVLGKCGGFTSDISDGMRWAAGLSVPGVPANPRPAKVINLSLGGSGACSTTQQSAINAIVAAGTTVVVAAGNSNADAASFSPASCANVISVAAVNRKGARAPYSNFGTSVKIAAPGGDTSTGAANGILSTLNAGKTTPGVDSYAFYQGTSMATPHIVGVVSLMLSVKPNLTPAQVLSILQKSARKFPTGTGRDCSATTSTTTIKRCGAGIVDAAAAVAAAQALP